MGNKPRKIDVGDLSDGAMEDLSEDDIRKVTGGASKSGRSPLLNDKNLPRIEVSDSLDGNKNEPY